jgi:hypothetical protein
LVDPSLSWLVCPFCISVYSKLRALERFTDGVKFESKHQINTIDITSAALVANATVVAHADTNVTCRSREDLEKQVKLIVEYQDSCEIFSNVQKVAMLDFNTGDQEEKIKWASHGDVTIQTGQSAERILGVC